MPDCPRSVPWSLLAPHERQAKDNHGGQTLVRLAERGGLGITEMVCVIDGKPFSEVLKYKNEEEALPRLLELLAAHEATRPKVRSPREVAEAALADEDIYRCGDEPVSVGVQQRLEDAVTTAIEHDRAVHVGMLRKTVALNRGQSADVLATGVLAWCDAVSARSP